MQISEVLEALGDERINILTPIVCPAGNLTIESADIMEIIVVYSQLVKTTMADLLKLILEGVIIGSTEIKMANADDDPLDTFEQEFKEEQMLIATTL